MLPAGVETNTPSPINFLITSFLLILRLRDAVCLLCLNKDISFTAINLLFWSLLEIKLIWSGFIVVVLALFTFLSRFLKSYLFIKKPNVPQLIP